MVDLVYEAQKGNDKAFLKLFQTYKAEVYRMAYVYVKNKEDALDVVQETAYRSFKSIQSLKNPEFFKTWLIKIAISCATDLLRKNKKVVLLNPEYNHSVVSVDEDIPLSLTLQEMLDALTESEKNIVFLKYYSGYTFNEISELVGAPVGTVKSILYRALEKLRKDVRSAGL